MHPHPTPTWPTPPHPTPGTFLGTKEPFFMGCFTMSPLSVDNNNSQGFWKFMNGYEGMCMSWGKFLKPWQVTDNIIEWIFSQFTFKILWVTLTQKIITHRVSKIHERFWGNVYEQGKFLKPWQVRDKIIEWIFSQFTFNIFMSDSNSKIITHRGFENSRIDMRGCVWVEGSFINHDKWQIKIFNFYFPIHINPPTTFKGYNHKL